MKDSCAFTARRLDYFERQLEQLFENERISRVVTYRSKGTRTFDAATGNYTSTDVDVNCRAIRTSIDETRRNIHQEGVHVFLIKGKDLTQRGITPKTDDFLKDPATTGDFQPVLELTEGAGQVFYRAVVAAR